MTFEYLSLTLKSVIRYLKYRRLPKAQGKRVIIAGNGPSLQQALDDYFDLLSNTPVFCVNFFANSPDYPKLRPLYYGIMDPALSLQNCFPRIMERREKLFSEIIDKTDWNMHLFFPFYPGQMVLENHFSKSNLHLHLCNIFPPFKIPVLRNPVYRSGLLMPPPQSVLVSAIYICLNMGYKEILLLGSENSWTQNMIVKDDNVLYIANQHFSGTSQESPWQKGGSGRTWKMHEILKALHKIFRSYHLLREYADYRGAKIYNLTPGSFIDAFERKTLGDFSTGEEQI